MSDRVRKLSHIIGFVLALATSPTSSYEFVTHAVMTQAAVGQFVKEMPGILGRLGIDDRSDVFGRTFLDTQSQTSVVRNVNDFEANIIRGPGVGTSPFSIAGWIMRGAIREDDDPDPEDRSPKGDDPWGDIHRVFR